MTNKWNEIYPEATVTEVDGGVRITFPEGYAHPLTYEVLDAEIRAAEQRLDELKRRREELLK